MNTKIFPNGSTDTSNPMADTEELKIFAQIKFPALSNFVINGFLSPGAVKEEVEGLGSKSTVPVN